ncbi:hypothetical protein DL96DRAFT_1535489 [Flagelloscypha sp. PMI_526]|nr:hypothetical protein DL96DRAFT_1535489 [Flagelloscypha sp. PMI_526]
MDLLSPVSIFLPQNSERDRIYVLYTYNLGHGAVNAEEQENETLDAIGRMRTRLDRLISYTRSIKPPSTSYSSNEYRKLQASQHPIYDGRYLAEETSAEVPIAPPIQLYHPVFSHFLEDLANPNLEVDPDTLQATLGLMETVSGVYEDEDILSEDLRPMLQKLFGTKVLSIFNQDESSPDGAVLSEKNIAKVLSEWQPTLGDVDDITTQLSLTMLRYWAQEADQYFKRSCCPTFLLAIAGPWMAVLGGVITDKCIVQRLTDFIWIGNDSVLNDSHSHRVSRVFQALNTSLKRLETHHQAITQADAVLDNPSRFFPFISCFKEDDRDIKFGYIKPLEMDSMCVIFKCRTLEQEPRTIVVKFVQSYGEVVHRFLSGQKLPLAPHLLYYGPLDTSTNAPLYGNLNMVVMEFLEGSTAYELAQQDSLPADFYMQASNVVKLLHSHGFVHGDVRLPNFFLTGTEPPAVKMMDFDWSGKEGEVRYPAAVSLRGRPRDVIGYGKITQAHDLYMLERLVSSG